MFKDTNKGAVAIDDGSAQAAKPADKAAPAEESKEPEAKQPPATDQGQGNMAESMLGKLQGSSLSSSLGGGSSGFSGMGGFGNKFNQGSVGGKSGFSAGIGSGFSNMPKFDQRKSKMLAMKSPARSLIQSSKSGKAGKGTGAFGQAKALRATQKSYTGSNSDSQRSTQDKAWAGSTGDGSATGAGAGVSDGGAGVVTSPSLDNTSTSSGGGTPDATSTPDTTPNTDSTEWSSLASKCMMLVMASCVLAFIASKVAKIKPYGYIIAAIIGAIAAILAIAAIAIAIQLMGSQKLLGGLYLIGGLMALTASGMAIAGCWDNSIDMDIVMWLAGGAAVIGMMGSMFGAK
jgi:hypothetical protein